MNKFLRAMSYGLTAAAGGYFYRLGHKFFVERFDDAVNAAIAKFDDRIIEGMAYISMEPGKPFSIDQVIDLDGWEVIKGIGAGPGAFVRITEEAYKNLILSDAEPEEDALAELIDSVSPEQLRQVIPLISSSSDEDITLARKMLVEQIVCSGAMDQDDWAFLRTMSESELEGLIIHTLCWYAGTCKVLSDMSSGD